MTLVICVDDAYGMLFHDRRQSKDAHLRKRLLQYAEGKCLRMNGYSAGQFAQEAESICVSEDFLQQARAEDICLVENVDCRPWLTECSRLILYFWNRKYPADQRFPAERLTDFTLVSTEDFAGSSHERITERIYEKK